MRSVVLAAAQLAGNENAPPGPAVVKRVIECVDQAAEQGADLLALPELALTSYFSCVPFPGAEAAAGWYLEATDPLVTEILGHADLVGVDLVLPFAELHQGNRYNSALVYKHGQGIVGTYRKVHTPKPVEFTPGKANAYESEWFSRGDGFPVFDLGGYRIGVHICYDRHFPESARSLTLQGADVVVLVSNSQSYGTGWRTEVWDMICRLRAYENTVFFLAANKTGPEGDIDWHGRSCITSPAGEILEMAPYDVTDSVVCARVDLDLIASERERRRFLAERQPQAYAPIVAS